MKKSVKEMEKKVMNETKDGDGTQEQTCRGRTDTSEMEDEESGGVHATNTGDGGGFRVDEDFALFAIMHSLFAIILYTYYRLRAYRQDGYTAD